MYTSNLKNDGHEDISSRKAEVTWPYVCTSNLSKGARRRKCASDRNYTCLHGKRHEPSSVAPIGWRQRACWMTEAQQRSPPTCAGSRGSPIQSRRNQQDPVSKCGRRDRRLSNYRAPLSQRATAEGHRNSSSYRTKRPGKSRQP